MRELTTLLAMMLVAISPDAANAGGNHRIVMSHSTGGEAMVLAGSGITMVHIGAHHAR